ncbi:MAG: hypothetical protein JWP27_2969, partial [Flaviaesturariibacter sp.]|nr:hypothetical protein [Flaviaesturariibacter sp.]
FFHISSICSPYIFHIFSICNPYCTHMQPICNPYCTHIAPISNPYHTHTRSILHAYPTHIQRISLHMANISSGTNCPDLLASRQKAKNYMKRKERKEAKQPQRTSLCAPSRPPCLRGSGSFTSHPPTIASTKVLQKDRIWSRTARKRASISWSVPVAFAGSGKSRWKVTACDGMYGQLSRAWSHTVIM